MTSVPGLADDLLPWNVVFEPGSVDRAADSLDQLGFRRALVLSTGGRGKLAGKLAQQLGARHAATYDSARPHVPMDTVDEAIAVARESAADCCMSIGGGSTTGLGKALALKIGLPNIAVPTSYAGSEMTPIWGITRDGKKTTGRDDRVLPNLVIYDPLLTLHLPKTTSLSSGMNAIAQAVVNIMEPAPDPRVETMALQAVRLLSGALPDIFYAQNDIEARYNALQGACLAGAALGVGVTSLHHRLCHIFGGRFNTNHADTHAVLLPHCVAYNTPAVPNKASVLAECLGAGSAAAGLWNLARNIDAPASLSSIGLKKDDLDLVTAIAMQDSPRNPRPLSRTGIRQLLQNAYDGIAPQ